MSAFVRECCVRDPAGMVERDRRHGLAGMVRGQRAHARSKVLIYRSGSACGGPRICAIPNRARAVSESVTTSGSGCAVQPTMPNILFHLCHQTKPLVTALWVAQDILCQNLCQGSPCSPPPNLAQVTCSTGRGKAAGQSRWHRWHRRNPI